MKKLLPALMLLLCVVMGNSQPINTSKLDSVFETLEANNKIMVSAVIYKNGKVLYAKAIGFKKIDDKQKLTADIATKYRIGSITKMFTATMIFQLVDEGKLTLDTKLDKFFSKVPSADKITIGQLLNHHSGLHNFTNDAGYGGYYTQKKTQAEMLEMIYKLPMDFTPGAQADYSNTNYVLLGYIIENLTGKMYADELRTRICAKAGLTNTYYGMAANATKNEAFSYSFNGKDWDEEAETDMSIPHGAGAIVSTATDLGKFAEALFQGKLISSASLREMMKQTDGYGMGCFTFPFGAREAYGHTGGIDAFSSMLGYFPDDSLSVAITINGSNYSMNDAMIYLLNEAFGVPYEIPQFGNVVFTPEKLAAYEGVYAAENFPLKITIKAANGVLTAQATGQGAFPLDANSETNFTFSAAGIIMDFVIEESGVINKFNFSQGGGKYLFEKQK